MFSGDVPSIICFAVDSAVIWSTPFFSRSFVILFTVGCVAAIDTSIAPPVNSPTNPPIKPSIHASTNTFPHVSSLTPSSFSSDPVYKLSPPSSLNSPINKSLALLPTAIAFLPTTPSTLPATFSATFPRSFLFCAAFPTTFVASPARPALESVFCNRPPRICLSPKVFSQPIIGTSINDDKNACPSGTPFSFLFTRFSPAAPKPNPTSVAIGLSADVTKDTPTLPLPVIISLPIPSGNPIFFVISSVQSFACFMRCD